VRGESSVKVSLGEGKETCPETRIEIVNIEKIMFGEGMGF
jgi:hypothetical protein